MFSIGKRWRKFREFKGDPGRNALTVDHCCDKQVAMDSLPTRIRETWTTLLLFLQSTYLFNYRLITYNYPSSINKKWYCISLPKLSNEPCLMQESIRPGLWVFPWTPAACKIDGICRGRRYKSSGDATVISETRVRNMWMLNLSVYHLFTSTSEVPQDLFLAPLIYTTYLVTTRKIIALSAITSCRSPTSSREDLLQLNHRVASPILFLRLRGKEGISTRH